MKSKQKENKAISMMRGKSPICDLIYYKLSDCLSVCGCVCGFVTELLPNEGSNLNK